jgi:hypothetical protein
MLRLSRLAFGLNAPLSPEASDAVEVLAGDREAQ